MARTFDGTDDVIRTSTGALSSATAFGTFVAIIRRNANSVFHTPMGLHASGGTIRANLQINDSGRLQYGHDTSSVDSGATLTVTTSDSWVLVAANKATGTAAVNFHKYVYSSGAWTHVTAGTMSNGTSVGASGYFETSWQGGDLFNGDIAVAAIFAGVSLTDSQIESLPHSLAHWLAMAPTALWMFDQSLTTQSVVDVTGGGSNQSALTGTAVASQSVPGFGYGASPIVLATPVSAITVNVDQGSETDTAQTVTPSKTGAVVQASETDTAQTVAPVHVVAVGQASEADTADVVTPTAPGVGQAVETDTATVVSPVHVVAAGQASETDTAGIVTPTHAASASQAVETDTAQTVTPSKLGTLGQASETDTALTVTAIHVIAVGQAVETDTAGATIVAGATVVVQVRQAVESDTAGSTYTRRTSMGFGVLSIERITLRETFSVAETTGSPRRLSIQGEESSPPLVRDEVIRRHDQMLGLRTASVVQFTLADKPERNGYYLVRSVDTDLTEFVNEVVQTKWTIELDRIGGEGEVDIESRLTGVARANDFSLTGERWHAPAVGHYAYYTAGSIPTVMTRATEEGTMTVYRSLAAGVQPRWGCTPENYLLGRVRVLSDGLERTGRDVRVTPTDWELSNAVVRVRPYAGGIEVAAWDSGVWVAKQWTVKVGTTAITSWDAVTVLRNDYEQCVIRLTKSRAPGRAILDLTLRRGSRLLEGFFQRDDSGTLSVSLTTPETLTDNSAAGYVVATSNDGDGNKVIAGSARSFTAHADGGVSKGTITKLDFFVGVVLAGSSAVSGDTALDVRNQYIASLAEATAAVGR